MRPRLDKQNIPPEVSAREVSCESVSLLALYAQIMIIYIISIVIIIIVIIIVTFNILIIIIYD